jgi:hypothetical protein
MAASSDMIVEGGIGPVDWIQESILVEALRVVLLEATPVDKVKARGA